MAVSADGKFPDLGHTSGLPLSETCPSLASDPVNSKESFANRAGDLLATRERRQDKHCWIWTSSTRRTIFHTDFQEGFPGPPSRSRWPSYFVEGHPGLEESPSRASTSLQPSIPVPSQRGPYDEPLRCATCDNT